MILSFSPLAAHQFLQKQLTARNPLLSRLLGGTCWSAISGMVNQGGTMITAVIVARLLGQTAFGKHAVVLSTLMAIGVLAQTGLAFSAAKHIAEFRSTDRARASRIIGSCAILGPLFAGIFALGAALSAPLVAERVLGSADLAVPLAVGAVFVFFSAVNSIQTGVLTGLECYRSILFPATVSTFLQICFVAGGTLLAGVTGAFAGLSAGTAVRCYLYRRVLKIESHDLSTGVSYIDLRREMPLLYSFAFPATLTGYLMIATLWFSTALLVRQPGGHSQMATYAAAVTVRQIVMFFPQILNTVGLMVLNNVRRGSAPGTYSSVHRLNIITLTGLTAVMSLIVGACGPWILGIFGKGFAASGAPILAIVLVSAVVESAMMGAFQAVQAAGRMWTALLAIGIPWQVTFAIAAFLLVPRFAAAGLAAANLAALCVALIASAVVALSINTRVGSATVEGERQGVAGLTPCVPGDFRSNAA